MINDLALFSTNEELDEISTANLRYCAHSHCLFPVERRRSSDERTVKQNHDKILALLQSTLWSNFGIIFSHILFSSSSEFVQVRVPYKPKTE